MFERSADQELFQETTRRFLESQAPVAKVRSMAASKPGFEPDYWRRGAELGWTSFAVPESAGGGSISGNATMDLVLLAYEFGLHAAPGPLTPVNVVGAALGRWGSAEQKSGALAEILSGEKTAAWVSGFGGPRSGGVEVRADGDALVLNGRCRPVEAGATAAWLLVAGRHDDGLTNVLVAADAPGVSVTTLEGVDLTRRYAAVDFADVRVPASSVVGEPGTGGAADRYLGDLAVVIQLAEMVGAMQWALDTTLDWAFNRYSFGRPLASYQEIKHRFADMKMWLEASYAITEEAADAVERDRGDRSEVVSAGKAYVGRYGAELMQDCVQIHGGIGVTADHDLHLFLRRVITSVPTYGSPTEHSIRIARILEAQEGAA